MTERHTLRRRTLLGATAAASLGALGSSGAASEDTTTIDSPVTPNDSHLAGYANRVGRITQAGLNEAFDDWSNGDITKAELDAVIDAWANGERVVEDGIYVIVLDSDITEDTLLEREPDELPPGNQVVYQVQGQLSVDAELKIEAGVAVEFQQQAGLDVGSGTIIGNGTANETILMTATLAKRGWWNGLLVRTPDLQNKLEHTIVEYGGRDNGCVDIASRFSGDEGLIELSNCTLRRSGSYGLFLSDGAALASGGGGNTYTNNRQGAAYARTENLHTLSRDSTYTGNDPDAEFVRVSANELGGDGPDETSRVWKKLDVPYRMTDGQHEIGAVELEIEAGTTFEFAQDSYPQLKSGSRLTFVGTEAEPITFTGTDPQRGWWDGLEIETGDIENVMKYVVVEYAGNDLPGNITVADRFSSSEGYLEMEQCTLRQSAGHGMYLSDNVELDTLSNTYTGNAAGAARILTESMHLLSDTSTFQGNDNEYVLVAPTEIAGNGPGETVLTWDALDVPYRMQSDIHEVDNLELVIDPGATFEFTQSARMRVKSNTRMTWSGVDGEEIDPIEFTGTDTQQGWWDGIEINTPDSDNLMEHVIVEYASNGLPGNITVADRFSASEGYLELTNCTFRQSGVVGIYLSDGAELDTSANTYTGNAAGAASVRTENIHMLSASSDFTGNDSDYVQVRGATLDGSFGDAVTWENINVPYRMSGGIHEVDGLTLTVDGGSTFEFTEGSRLRLKSNCSVDMAGVQSDIITLTGTNQQPGWWDGIEFETDSLLNSMTFVIVAYGGNDLPGNITFADRSSASSAYLEMSNCTLEHSAGDGMYLSDGAELVLDANLYTNNGAPVNLPAENAHELSGVSDFTGNDEDTVAVRGSDLDSSYGDTLVWDAINVPYRVTGDIQVDEVTFGIDPGGVVHFEEGTLLNFNDNPDSVVDISGTETDPVTFRAVDVGQEIQGWWRGILVKSGSVLNQMTNVVVENGGRNPGSTPEGNVHVDDSGELVLEDSTLADSGGAGVFVKSGGGINGDVCDVNEFVNNAGGDCVVN